MQQVTTLEGILRRDRVIVLVGLAVITLLAGAYMVYLAQDMKTGSRGVSWILH
jgi:predicted metal-binding membrane protein